MCSVRKRISKGKNGKFNDIAHPINSETREKITKAIMEAYENAEDPEPRAEAETEVEEDADAE